MANDKSPKTAIPTPTFVSLGATSVVDRTGRLKTREDHVRDLSGLVFSGEPVEDPARSP